MHYSKTIRIVMRTTTDLLVFIKVGLVAWYQPLMPPCGVLRSDYSGSRSLDPKHYIRGHRQLCRHDHPGLDADGAVFLMDGDANLDLMKNGLYLFQYTGFPCLFDTVQQQLLRRIRLV
jgi:hypothetical protein